VLLNLKPVRAYIDKGFWKEESRCIFPLTPMLRLLRELNYVSYFQFVTTISVAQRVSVHA
jgi:hypothetical protein